MDGLVLFNFVVVPGKILLEVGRYEYGTMKTVSWPNISINQFLGLGLIKYLMWHARVDKVAVSGRWKVDNRFASDSV